MNEKYFSGQFIKDKRQTRGMTQQQLAEAIGYSSKVAISDIERGKVTLPQSKIPALAEALGTSESELRVALAGKVPTMPGPHGEELDGKDPGEIVRIYREARGLTPSELALRLEIENPEQIARMEAHSEDFPAKIAVPVAQCLGIPADAFLKYVFDYAIRQTLKPEYIEQQKAKFKDHGELLDRWITSRAGQLKAERDLVQTHETRLTTLTNRMRDILYLSGGDLRIVKKLEYFLEDMTAEARSIWKEIYGDEDIQSAAGELLEDTSTDSE